MSETFRIQEWVQSAAVESIDREKGIIRGVKLLGEASVNPPPHDNLYPRETRAKAIALMEGRRVCIDHPATGQAGQTRPYEEGMGLVKNVREKGDGLYGDWHFPPKHRLAEQAFWDAENAPHNLGFSINGDGVKRRENGRALVEEITVLDSVDLVSRPATTNGIFEARHPMTTKKKVSALIESLKASRPGYARGLKEMAEAGLMSPDQEMEEPAAKGPELAADEAADHGEAILNAAIAVLRDTALDTPTKITKIRKLLGIADEGGASEAAPGEEGTEFPGSGSNEIRGKNQDGQKRAMWAKDPDNPYSESRKGKGKGGNLLEAALLQIKARDLAADMGVPLNPILRKAIEACKTEAEVKGLLESAKAPANGPQLPRLYDGARSAGPGTQTTPVQESRQDSQQPQDPDKARESRVQHLRRGR